MLHAHTVEQVRAAERELMARLPEGTLMQRAAAGLAVAVVDFLGSAYGRRVLLLVGSGDNGGDALYAGAVLARRGVQVEAWPLSGSAHDGGTKALKRAGGRVVTGPARRPEVVVDGIVGIGGRPGLRAEASNALKLLHGVPVVAVDTPSGVDVDTGEVDGGDGASHVEAALTVTFGTHKVCHLVDPAAEACGAVHLVDIGLDLPEPAVEALQPEDVAALLPRPVPDSQKYARGVVGVRAGSAQYPGAALLSVAGAACGLAGMVRYVGEEQVAGTVRAQHPEVVGAGRVQAWVVGSGGGDGAGEQLARALADQVPLIVDADALQHVTGPVEHAVLTPHAGELAAMLGEPRDAVEARPLHFAREAAQRYRATVLLKGRRTVVAGPDGRTRVNTTGTSWLATAGAGDVLGGVIGALLAAGLTAYDAASVGAWLHGAAAMLASDGGPLVAGDVARAIPDVVRGSLA
ncbi:MAG TPA: NAD(P)H-hydrate dehydratase [Nocardioides sp.]|uniref:NAD(P)H-hydrate dehydratase n=1 Tax=Nocardioides sp. TaxID=35761 RepID=UPI002E34DDFB|nr:NAD(P)H-hydrate dehydratase [Nocardioides sp.]HEX5090678.1 NAD(P)H-hydrate dehydratase [Nocardioides sp.]